MQILYLHYTIFAVLLFISHIYIRLMTQIIVHIADSSHFHFAPLICEEIEISAKIRGTGIAKRTIEYIEDKMRQGKAIIAHTQDGVWVGFCYIETWEDGKYVANSGLIVSREFRGHGIATKIKRKVFELSRSKYPKAKIFGLTTGAAVMKMNSDLGYRPVTYSELTSDESFWNGCSSCINHPILLSKNSKNCLCTAMLYEPQLIDISIPEHIQGESA